EDFALVELIEVAEPRQIAGLKNDHPLRTGAGRHARHAPQRFLPVRCISGYTPVTLANRLMAPLKADRADSQCSARNTWRLGPFRWWEPAASGEGRHPK